MAHHEPPPGGLDMPAQRRGAAEKTESFPGENTLTEEEKHRWLVLHFALPRTIMTWDHVEGRTTEIELNDVLSTMAWGTINQETSEWVLESEDPTPSAPHPSLISYADYVARMYPTDQLMDEEARKENHNLAARKRATFTNPGEPGVKFRPMFDQMQRTLAHLNKALMKAFNLKKVILNEEELPEDPTKQDAQTIMRYGRHQILPSFWQLLVQLTKRNRRFSIVLRTWDLEQLGVVQRELMFFCEGRHPAYSGQNKTQKPPPMNGDKSSRDLRLDSKNIGRLDRMGCPSTLKFADRPAEEDPGAPKEGEEIPAFRPTTYEFPPYHHTYSGLMHQILDSAHTVAIIDDYQYWNAKGRGASAGKLHLVDDGGGVAETTVQHIFFDGHIRNGDAHCVDVRDVVSGEPIPFEDADGVYLHKVDFFQAVVNPDYFVKAVEACELKFSQRIIEARRTREGDGADEAGLADALKAAAPKEYLYRTVMPALLPALEACQRDRPPDPIEFIAFYMLRHPKQYTKTLKA